MRRSRKNTPDAAHDETADTGEQPTQEFDTLIDADADAADPGDDTDIRRVSGWGRVLRGNRALWWVAAAAVVSLVAGLLVGRFLIGPGGAEAEAPEPGLVTVPVEFGTLSNDVTLRADVGYADAVDVTLDTSSVSGAAVVTGQVPEQGATLDKLGIVLEVVGRPVIVLPGELPAYRTLRFGVSGPDVTQLKQALKAVGIDPGDTNSNIFDWALADAVEQLYAEVGYPLPPAPEGAEDAVRAARDAVRSAESAVNSAQQQINQDNAGPSELEQWEADVAVQRAEADLAAAKKALESAKKGDGDLSVAEAQRQVQEAEWALTSAKLQRDQLWQNSGSGGDEMLQLAYEQLSAAQEDLETAQEGVLPYLPSSEVLYLTDLPRRVDAVNVTRGSVLQGAAMVVSGASLRLTAAAAAADAQLLEVGAEATFELADGTAHRAVIKELNAGKDAQARWEVLLEPDPMTPEQIDELRGSNVRLAIGVGATDGDVLSVPAAALTAGPGGESRVEVVEGDPRDGDRAETRMVVVETGLAARGAVEVRPKDGDLAEGDLVVVGR
ncbi:hypothetical protein [Microbacterium sp. YY-01]|uniref:hypothetical protein n=1 Tax=Microbacterium sp. YY-01 TaxID=3421634 RepID=UPI003D17AF87